MKQKILLTLLAASLAMPLSARTWTSADGSKTFTGDYVSSTETTVTVTIKGRKQTFKIDLLSEGDKDWLKEEKERVAKSAAEQASANDPGKIGSKLKGKLVSVSGKRFAKVELDPAPEYYLLYFSASW